jgi:hypothetical protein
MKNTVFCVVTLRRKADFSEEPSSSILRAEEYSKQETDRSRWRAEHSLWAMYAASLLFYVLCSTFPYAHIYYKLL